MAQQNDFDFKAFNDSIKNAGSGLQLHLVIGMLRNVAFTMNGYNNPLATDVQGAMNDLIAIKEEGKKQAAARAAAKAS